MLPAHISLPSSPTPHRDNPEIGTGQFYLVLPGTDKCWTYQGIRKLITYSLHDALFTFKILEPHLAKVKEQSQLHKYLIIPLHN